MRRVLIACALVCCASRALADGATDVGTGFTSTGTSGEVTADSYQGRDRGAFATPLANMLRLHGNDVPLTPDPSCAANGAVGMLAIIDADESAADNWKLCNGTTDLGNICATGTVCTGYQAGPLTGDVTTSGAAATIAVGVVTTGKILDATVAQVDIDDTATLAGNPAFGDSSVWFATTGIIFEGATSNTSEGLLVAADVTADRTWTLPNEDGTLCSSGSVCSGYQAGPLTGDVTTSGAAATIAANSVALTTDTTGNYVTSVSVTSPLTCTGCTAAEGSTPALVWDSTKVNNTTWGDATAATMVWTWNPSTGLDPTLDISGTAVVWNEAGLDVDFRIEGDTVSNLFFLDASADTVTLGDLILGTVGSDIVDATSCGTTPGTPAGSFNSGGVTTGSGTVNSCQINFTKSRSSRRCLCMINSSSTTKCYQSASTTTTVTFGFTASCPSCTVYWHCFNG